MLKDYIKPYPTLVFDDDIFEPLRLSYAPEVTNFPKHLDALAVSPDKHPRRIRLNNNLEAIRTAVSTHFFDFINPFPEKSVIFIINAFGWFDGSEANRTLNADGQLLDVICGNFLILGENPETGDFCSLTEDQFEFFEKMFFTPQIFVQEEKQLHSIPNPEYTVIKP